MDRSPAAAASTTRRGRHVQVGLLPPVDGHPRVPMARVIGWELALIESGALAPQRLIERVVGLDEAAALPPGFDRASPARDDDDRSAPRLIPRRTRPGRRAWRPDQGGFVG